MLFRSAQIVLILLLTCLAFGCGVENKPELTSQANINSAANDIIQRAVTVPPQDISNDTGNEFSKVSETRSLKSIKTVKCQTSNKYKFSEVENPDRSQEFHPVAKDLHVSVNDDLVAMIELPNTEAKNFSLMHAKQRGNGFEMKVEWGGGNFHYEIQFWFDCHRNNFYLYKVRNESYSTTDPNSGEFWDKKEIKTTEIKPNLPIENFSMLDYL